MNLNDLTATLAGLTEANRPIRLRLAQQGGVLDDVLLVQRISGGETICGGLEYRLLCVATRADLPLKEFIALPAEVQFVTDRGTLHAICGIVAQATAGPSDGALATYQLVVRDALALLAQRTNTRVFRHRSELDIASVILDEWRRDNPVLAQCFDVDWSHVTGTYPEREFTMQHNESDAHFLRRLWKRRGIAWFIRPGPASTPGSDTTPAHTLVLFDDGATLPANVAGTVRFHRDSGTEQRDAITAWSAVRTLVPGTVARQSWDYQQARTVGSSAASCIDQGTMGNELAASLDDYLVDVPHAGTDGADYRALGELRMQRHEYESKCFQGEGSVRTLRVGEWFALADHPEIDTHAPAEREFIVTELTIEAENNLPKQVDERVRRLLACSPWREESALGATRYANRFSCVRRGTPLVPVFDPRVDLPQPRIQSAIVVGPPGEEIHCDELGRVKLRFPATRAEDHEHAQGAGASDSERDSAWVRVASSWAGERWGALLLPRVGTEVIVDFLGGDPDKPIVVGQVYNGHQAPAVFSHVGTLPANRNLAGIVSREVHGSRCNQLRLDDTPGQISAQLASEHGHSQLNLGWLSHPRSAGKGAPRGEGAELRSDRAVAVRGAAGVLITAAGSAGAGGGQLDRAEATGLMDALHVVQQELSRLSSTHHAGETDDKRLRQLGDYLRDWAAGSNTQEGGTGGAAAVAISAPAGVAVTANDNVVLGAQTDVDIVSIGSTQLSVGKKLLARVAESISLFAHRLGIQLIAASGKLELQTHADDIEVTSSKRIVLTATDEIVLQAPKIRFVAQGAQVELGGGVITQQSSGVHTIESSEFAHVGPGDGATPAAPPPASESAHDQQAVLRWIGTDEPMKNRRYRITMEDGRTIEGRTDGDGKTERFDSAIPFARYTVEALDDEGQ